MTCAMGQVLRGIVGLGGLPRPGEPPEGAGPQVLRAWSWKVKGVLGRFSTRTTELLRKFNRDVSFCLMSYVLNILHIHIPILNLVLR